MLKHVIVRQLFVQSLLYRPPVRFNSTTSTVGLANTLRNLRPLVPPKPNANKSNPRNEEQVQIKHIPHTSREWNKKLNDGAIESNISPVRRSLPLSEIQQTKISQFHPKKYVSQPLDWSTFDKRRSVDVNTLTPKSRLSEEERISLRLEAQGGDYVRYLNVNLASPVSTIVGSNASYALTDKEKVSNVIFKSINNCND